MEKTKKILINFRLPEELIGYLKDQADKEYMTVTAYVIKLINQDKKKNK